MEISERKRAFDLQWDLKKLEMVSGLLGSKWKAPDLSGKKSGHGPGGYCNGESIDECRKIFGDGLPRVCETCPD